MRITGLALLLALCATSCTGRDDGGPALPDAATDAPEDASPCGADRFVTGELVDLDSSTSQLTGVFNARLTVEGMPGRTATTAPNGRFELCVPAGSAVTLDVDAPADYLDGKAYLEAELGGGTLSFRAYTAQRGSMLYDFDPGRGHVLVFFTFDGAELSLDRAHDAPLAGNDHDRDGTFTWTAGRSGRYVLFPNVDVSSPTIQLNGDYAGPHTIPVSAGTLTLAAITIVYF
jgi:hypothetical protein